jgi:starvation-inducible DNA-binding protein
MMIHTRNTLPEATRQRSVDLLNQNLAAAIDLHAQVKQAHWNVRGPNFIAIHELFDAVAAGIEEAMDSVAERAGALGGTAHGTVQCAVERSTLIPYPLGIADEVQHLAAVSGALAAFGEMLRNAIASADQIGDAATVDLFTTLARAVDQQLWKVESHLYRG